MDLRGMPLDQSDIEKVLSDTYVVWDDGHASELAAKILGQEEFNLPLHTGAIGAGELTR